MSLVLVQQLPGAFRPLAPFLQSFGCGHLDLALPDGRRLSFAGGEPGPRAGLTVHSPRFVHRLLTGGANGFAESYLESDFDPPDLTALLALFARNADRWSEGLQGRAWYRLAQRAYHLLHRNSRAGSRRNILAHYDLGNDFYGRWLDTSMTYSAALYEGADDDLETAQQAKYRAIAELAGIARGDRVLEIGCGWGGFACIAAKECGADVTAITISDAQYAYARERVQREGLGERVRVLRQDYRDTEGSFDRVVSIEMFEAVGEAYWPLFFDRLRSRLRPGGGAALQIITIDDRHFPRYRRRADFIQRHVFPGGMLPSPTALQRAIGAAGLAVARDRGRGADYARTLAEWRGRFEAAWPELAGKGFDERFHRLWRYYLAYCEAGFLTQRIDLRQLAIRHR